MFLIILWCWWNPTWAQIICQTCFDCFLFCVGSSNAPDSPVSAPKMSQTLQTWFLLILSCIFVEIHKTLKYFRFNILRPQLLFWMDFLFLVAIWDQSDLTGLKTKHYPMKSVSSSVDNGFILLHKTVTSTKYKTLYWAEWSTENLKFNALWLHRVSGVSH